jgi:small subunit ribosomal protein S2
MTFDISLKELLDAGAHFGHQSRRWNPKMAPYLYGVEKGIHVFDLVKTKAALEEALEAIKRASAEGKTILLLGTKKQAKDKVIEIGEATGCPFVSERWLGGTFSNFEQIKRSINKLAEMKVEKLAGGYEKFTKKERLLLDREISRLERFFGGVSKLEKLPDMLFMADIHKQTSAIREARAKGMTIVGIVDSNDDPTLVDYPIPMNDDATKALEYVLELVRQAIMEGKSGIGSKSSTGSKGKAAN